MILHPPKQFKRTSGDMKGCLFTLIARNRGGFLYEVDHGTFKTYEVFRKKANRSKTGVLRYSYPRSDSFGVYAWCFKSIEKANVKFGHIEIA